MFCGLFVFGTRESEFGIIKPLRFATLYRYRQSMSCYRTEPSALEILETYIESPSVLLTARQFLHCIVLSGKRARNAVLEYSSIVNSSCVTA